MERKEADRALCEKKTYLYNLDFSVMAEKLNDTLSLYIYSLSKNCKASKNFKKVDKS